MVTFELAIGILSACLVAAALGWGVSLITLQSRCSDAATQIARQLARGDQQAADEAIARAPKDAQVITEPRPGEIKVTVLVEASWGAFGPVQVKASAVLPVEGG